MPSYGLDQDVLCQSNVPRVVLPTRIRLAPCSGPIKEAKTFVYQLALTDKFENFHGHPNADMSDATQYRMCAEATSLAAPLVNEAEDEPVERISPATSEDDVELPTQSFDVMVTTLSQDPSEDVGRQIRVTMLSQDPM
eukprot:1141631-Pelagomonas_calceolata.AAC.8